MQTRTSLTTKEVQKPTSPIRILYVHLYCGRDAVVNVIIDETLCENLYFLDDGGYERAKVLPLPHDYYNYDEVKNSVINYNGDSRGYLEIQFTDKFFQDAKATSNDTTYVIPVRMTGVTGIDALLSGTPNKDNAVRQNANDWSVLPMDYTLYCVRFMNPWQGKYIRRGVDQVTEGGTTTKVVRKDFSMYFESCQPVRRGLRYSDQEHDTGYLPCIVQDLWCFDSV